MAKHRRGPKISKAERAYRRERAEREAWMNQPIRDGLPGIFYSDGQHTNEHLPGVFFRF